MKLGQTSEIQQMLDSQTVSYEEEDNDYADVEFEDLRGLNEFQCHCSRNYLHQFSAVYVEIHITLMTKDENEMGIMGVYNLSGRRNIKRKKKQLYMYEGNTICRQSFQYVFLSI